MRFPPALPGRDIIAVEFDKSLNCSYRGLPPSKKRAPEAGGCATGTGETGGKKGHKGHRGHRGEGGHRDDWVNN